MIDIVKKLKRYPLNISKNQIKNLQKGIDTDIIELSGLSFKLI